MLVGGGKDVLDEVERGILGKNGLKVPPRPSSNTPLKPTRPLGVEVRYSGKELMILRLVWDGPKVVFIRVTRRCHTIRPHGSFFMVQETIQPRAI